MEYNKGVQLRIRVNFFLKSELCYSDGGHLTRKAVMYDIGEKEGNLIFTEF